MPKGILRISRSHSPRPWQLWVSMPALYRGSAHFLSVVVGWCLVKGREAEHVAYTQTKPLLMSLTVAPKERSRRTLGGDYIVGCLLSIHWALRFKP